MPSVSRSTLLQRLLPGADPRWAEAVEAAITKFNFRPNAAARGLALGKTLTIGVVAQAIDSPFYGEGLRGIEAGLRQHGYAPLLMSGNWHEEDEDRCIREFIARGVDGIIVFAGQLSEEFEKELHETE